MREKKWNFIYPTGSPSTFQKAKLAIVRAHNNLKYGFDGTLTPLQLGVLKPKAKPLLKIEVALTHMLLNGEVLSMIKTAALSGRKVLTDAKKSKRLLDLHENS